jgi:hypothetical protein
LDTRLTARDPAGGGGVKPHIADQIAALQDLTLAELREHYAEVFGEPTTCRHKRHLQKRIAWGIQAREMGGISERARRRAEELARDTDLRLLAPKKAGDRDPTVPTRITAPRDPRLPMVGSIITREYKGRTVSVTVLDGNRFEYAGETYRSLSAVARAVTGTRWNGMLFFGLTKKGRGK